MKKFFLHNDSGQQGPFGAEDLKTLHVTRDTPVWYEGLESWTTAGKVEELKFLFQATPPPFAGSTPSSEMPPPIPQKKRTVPYTPPPAKPKRKTPAGLIVIIVLVLLGIFGVSGYYLYTQVSGQITESNEEDKKALYRNNIKAYVTAESNNYLYSSLGGISNLEVSVTNSTEYLVDDVRVAITYIKSNGSVWRTKNFDFGMIGAGSTVRKQIPDTDRGTGIELEVVHVKSAALGLN